MLESFALVKPAFTYTQQHKIMSKVKGHFIAIAFDDGKVIIFIKMMRFFTRLAGV